MHFSLNEEQQMMADATRRMTRERIEPILARHPIDKPLPKAAVLEIYRLLAELGITAPRIPADAGGGGLKMLDYGLMIEQLPPVVALSLISHEGTISRIHSGCSDEIRRRYLPDLIAGRKIACTANTEAGAGSDSAAIRTRLRVQGEWALVTGSKMWITNASVADVINVSCSEGENADGRAVTRRVLLDRAECEFEVRETAVMGLQQGHLSELVFEGTRVPVGHILGDAGDAARTLTVGWNANRPLLGLMCVHLAQKAFELAVEHAKTHRQFGKVIGGHQLVQQDLADIETLITTSRLACYSALDALDGGARCNGTAAMAKRHATQACERAIQLAMQVHGGMGISREAGLERLWRDARMFQVPDGMNGILALIQGRELVGLGAFR